MASLPSIVAKMRLFYHGQAIDINNVLNQLHIRSDEEAEEKAKHHCMIIINDIFPRLGIDITELLEKENKEES